MPIIKKEDSTPGGIPSPGLEVRVVVNADRGSDSLYIEELTVAPDARVPRRVNANTEAVVIILEGTVDVTIGRERNTIGPGHTVLAPAGAIHGFVNRFAEPARLLFVYPTHQVEGVLASALSEKVGFASETGLRGYTSAEDRPLDSRE